MSTATTTITAEPGQQSIHITRDFAATPAQLLRAYTDPAILPQWLGPREGEMRVEQLDATNGGRWRYVHQVGDEIYGFRGVFHNDPSVEAGIIQTFEFEGYPGNPSLEKLTFEDLGDGRTRLHGVSVFLSVQARDGMVESGMETGVSEGYEKLDALLAGGQL